MRTLRLCSVVMPHRLIVKTNERNGIIDFMNILRSMPSMDIIEFGVEDIVRSGLCKEYLLAKMDLGL